MLNNIVAFTSHCQFDIARPRCNCVCLILWLATTVVPRVLQLHRVPSRAIAAAVSLFIYCLIVNSVYLFSLGRQSLIRVRFVAFTRFLHTEKSLLMQRSRVSRTFLICFWRMSVASKCRYLLQWYSPPTHIIYCRLSPSILLFTIIISHCV